MENLDEHKAEEATVYSWEDRLKEVLRFDEKNWFNNLPLILFIAALGVLHVANNHTAINKIRQSNSLEQDIKELRWTYMTSKSELMYKSKQSEVAKMVNTMGLKELTKPPFKIVINNDDYK